MNTTVFQSDSDANGTRAQRVEELALRIMEMPAVKEAVAKGLQKWKESDAGKKPGALRYAQSAADEIATLASLYCAMGTVPDPSFVWVYAAPRKWHGYYLPGSRWYADNVDTHYRGLRVDENASYVVTIQVGDRLAPQLTFMIWDWILYENGPQAKSDVPMDTFVVTEETPRNPDGTITLTVDPEPANGRPNHLQLKPGARQLFFREIKDDWSIPSTRLSVERVGGPIPKVKDLEELAQEAANYILAGASATLQIEVVVGNIKENELNPLMVRWLHNEEGQKMVTDELLGPDRAGGFLSSGLFNLQEDEALVMTLNMLGTKYLSVNTYRPFLVSPEHVYGSSSLNNYQSEANPDGSISFVLARKDPGVYNWLDVGGIPFGEIAVRWQTLTHPVSGTLKTATQTVKVVKLADLRQELPPTTKWVTAEERAEQREARAKLFQLRCLGTPCEVGGELDKMY
jgi:hypothetical protein